MTKRWSSTASMDGQTKRQASKSARRKEEREIAAILEKYKLDPIGECLESIARGENMRDGWKK